MGYVKKNIKVKNNLRNIMPIITYGPFPPSPNKGYVHYDVVTGGQFIYIGGSGGAANNVLNWKLIGGELSDQPSTIGWGALQRGARWFNSTLGNFYGWNGSIIVILG